MNILVTGGSGFLGSALARHFARSGARVALLLRPDSSLRRLAGQEATFDIGRYVTDADVEAFVQRVQPEVVIHTACAYGRQGETALQLADVNVRLGLVLMTALERVGNAVTFIHTGTVLTPAVGPYALSKNQFAQWGRLIAGQSAGKIRFVNVLLQHMYGPGDDRSKFATHVLHACHHNEPELRLTAGEQERDFIFIDDVVSAYETLVAQREQLPAVMDIDVGSGIAPAIRDFVRTVHRLTGSVTRLAFGALQYRANEAMYCRADLAAMNALGWKPEYDLETGLKKTIELEFSK